jgi:hypothetical protein
MHAFELSAHISVLQTAKPLLTKINDTRARSIFLCMRKLLLHFEK